MRENDFVERARYVFMNPHRISRTTSSQENTSRVFAKTTQIPTSRRWEDGARYTTSHQILLSNQTPLFLAIFQREAWYCLCGVRQAVGCARQIAVDSCCTSSSASSSAAAEKLPTQTERHDVIHIPALVTREGTKTRMCRQSHMT